MKIAIIGGGAAGMMTAATINESNPDIEVVVIEKNNALGKKVIISGGGRCNVTTGIEDIKKVLENYPRGNKFLISAMHRFSPTAVQAWFETHDVPLKCEKDLRVFPVSNNGMDVVEVFNKIFAKYKTEVLYLHTVSGISKIGEKFTIEFDNHPPITADQVVLAVGGQAYRHTGSTGDGYTLAESLGHTITSLAPSLHSFVTQQKWPRSLSGLSFIKATITADCAKPNSRTGPFLFTHSGISGPAVFAVSSMAATVPFGDKNPLNIFIDFFPDQNTEQLTKEFQIHCKENPKKIFKNTLHHFLPLSLCEAICQAYNLPGDKKSGEVSMKEISLTVSLLKKIPLKAIGRGNGEEFVTAGGIELTEVNPQTMESKKCPGLYLCGEILNIDGFTGGFNLQAAWATGRTAGENISQL